MPIFLSFILKSFFLLILLFLIGKKTYDGFLTTFFCIFICVLLFYPFSNLLIEKLNVLYEKNWTTLVHEQLRRFEGSIVAATRNSHSNTDSSHNGVMMLSTADNQSDTGRWSFSEALLYSISVITTIGKYIKLDSKEK